MLKFNTILQGDALTKLKELPEKSINMCMTSPPYWALRDYGVEGQLGLEPTFDEYIKKLCDIFDEVKRVLRDDGTCWVNIGDTYYGSGKGAGGDLDKAKESYQMPVDWKRPSRDEYTKAGIKKNCLICGKEFLGKENSQFCSTKCLNKKGNDFRSQNRQLPDKCLTMIPQRFAIEMVRRGWILRNTIIWHKNNCMPCSVKDRFTVDFEYLFFFSKKKKYYFETQYEPLLTNEKRPDGIVRNREQGYNSKENNNPEAYLKQDNVPSKNSNLYKGFNKRYVQPIQGRNKRTVWTINHKPFKDAHFAVYPEELCETPIKAGCPEAGIVLDPFFGAGTTGLVALKQNKKFIGIELNPEYIEIAKKRLKPFMEQTKLGCVSPCKQDGEE